jgi:ribosomal protein S18 acetylase RimI-like enzyme
MDMWLPFMREVEIDGESKKTDDKIINWGKKIINIQEERINENKIYNIELFIVNENIVGFCFFALCEIKQQQDTEYGLIIKPLVDFNDYGYIMEFYIKPEYRMNNYGTIMFNHIKMKLKRDSVNLIMTTSHVSAIRFWEKLGFINTGRVDPDNGQFIYKYVIESNNA